MIKKALTYTLLIVASLSNINATTPETEDAKQYQTWIDSASEAYRSQQFSKAVEYYEKVLNFGMTSADLHYNLGNAYYKQGMVPHAILHYEKALKYNPAHEDARVNLQMANNLITDRIEAAHIPFYKRWYNQLWKSMPANSWATGSIITFLVLIGSILLFVFGGSIVLKKTMLPVAILALILMSVSLVMGSEAKSYMENTHKAILFEPSLNVKSSPDESGTDLFRIHEGLKIEIREQLGEWTEIEIPDGRVGWVPTDSYREI